MPEQEPLTKAEPVALLDLVKLAIVAVGYFGVQVPEDTGLKVGAAIVALYAFVQATWFTRKAVTPVARADAREGAALAHEREAYEEGLAVGEHDLSSPPKATVVQVAADPPDLARVVAALNKLGVDATDTDIDQVAPPAPPAPPPRTAGLPIDWGNTDDIATRQRIT